MLDLAARMQDPAFWHTLAPGLNTGGMGIGPTLDVPDAAIKAAGQDLVRDGYSQIDGVLPTQDLTELLQAMDAVRKAGLLPLYIFAFDEAWAPFLRLAKVWRALLGPEWGVIPSIWAWWVEQGAQNAGWPAHKDRATQDTELPDGRPHSLTCWIPLTRATPANGCMYVAPKSLDIKALNSISIQQIRALPAAPGTILLWKQNVWHWSGRSSRRAQSPRVSLSFEFQNRAVPPFEAGYTWNPLEVPMPLHRRLAVLGEMVVRYRHFNKLEGEPVALAEALAAYA